MVKSSPGVNPKPRFGPIIDSTALHMCVRVRAPLPARGDARGCAFKSRIGPKRGFGLTPVELRVNS